MTNFTRTVRTMFDAPNMPTETVAARLRALYAHDSSARCEYVAEHAAARLARRTMFALSAEKYARGIGADFHRALSDAGLRVGA